jgi:hypothetical protein
MSASQTFKTSVDSFEAASTDMERINEYLTKLNEFLAQFDWDKVPKKGGGGEGSGTKPPPRWP